MQQAAGSFYWSEDFDQGLNYWFWLHGLGELDESALIDRVGRLLGMAPIEVHNEQRGETRFPEYLAVWRQWKLDQTGAQINAARARSPRTLKAHYEAVAAVAPRPFSIQWVMAPFGKRWVFSPDVVVLGADGGDAELRRRAVLEAARALRPA